MNSRPNPTAAHPVPGFHKMRSIDTSPFYTGRSTRSDEAKSLHDLNTTLDKLHTTSSGAARVKRNISLQTGNVVLWCREFIRQADIIISRGKNWYVYGEGIAVTIHAQSCAIITAHRINAKVRVMQKSDYACLPEFLYQAIFIPKGTEPPSRDIINEPEINVYIKDF
jgi:hypothetical protein